MRSLLLLFGNLIAMAVSSVFGRTGDVIKAEGDYNLTDLGDVTIATPSNGQALVYNSTSSEWENTTLANSVAGSDRQVQFNDSGTSFGADSEFILTTNKDLMVGYTSPVVTDTGRRIIGVKGSTGAGVFEMTSAETPANNVVLGGFQWTDDTNDFRAVAYFARQTGTTTASLGGQAEFFTKPDGTGVIARRFVLTADGKTKLGDSDPAAVGTAILTVNAAADGALVDFAQGGVVEGSISVSGNTVTYGSFCGVHPTQPTGIQQISPLPPVGGVLVSIGDQIESELTVWQEPDGTDTRGQLSRLRDKVINFFIGNEHEFLSELKGRIIPIRLPDDMPDNEKSRFTQKTVRVANKEIYVYVDSTITPNDKRVYGVFVSQIAETSNQSSFGANNSPVWHIAALGHYKIRVTDLGGNIANGDYLTSSSRAFEAMKQSDDVLHSYTVGKSLIDVDWSQVQVDPELGYKWALIPATLHCG